MYSRYKNKKMTIDYVKKFINKTNYKFLNEDEYENIYSVLKIECPKGHIFESTWNNFIVKDGSRCPTCRKENIKMYNNIKKFKK